MSTAESRLTVRGIPIEVVRKDIKNLHLGVYPPTGRVRVAAPVRMESEQVRLAVIQRLPWIRKQRRQFRTAARQTPREMVTGESHYVWGKRLRLKVVKRPGRAHVEVDGDRLLLYVPEGYDATARLSILQSWQRTELKRAVPPIIERWEQAIGRTVPQWGIRRMKTKWGSCNRDTGHMWFNLELAKKHPHSLEYVVVHEMAHLLERNHGEAFTKLMDSLLADWGARRDALNAAPLADEVW